MSTLKTPEQAPTQDQPKAAIAIEAKLTPREASSAAPSAVPPAIPIQPKPAVTEAAVAPKAEEAPQAEPAMQQRKAGTQQHHSETSTQPDNTAPPQPATSNLEVAATLSKPHAPQPGEPAKPLEKPNVPIAQAPDLKESLQPRTEPARDISFRIASADSNPVDVRFTDRAGQIHVSVRTADLSLTRSLQDNVSELAGKLERSGFHTETQIPHRSEVRPEAQTNPNFQESPRDRRSPFYDPQRPKRSSRSSASAFEIEMPQNNTKDNNS